MTNPRVKISLSLWGVAWAVTSALSVLSHRSVTPAYHGAVEAWIQHLDLYADSGFFYFPQFVYLFFPFHVLPTVAGELLWRLISVALLVCGIWRLLTQDHLAVDRGRAFLMATLIVLFPALDAMRNGQANVIFAGLTMLAAADLSRIELDKKAATSAGIFLIGSLAAKPIGIVMMGLASLSSPALRWRLAVLMVLFIALPYLFSPAWYATRQYESLVQHLSTVSVLSENRFADFNGLLRAFGYELTGASSLAIRAGTGLGIAAIWLLVSRRCRPADRGFILLTLTTGYLLLFNPMTEQNSVVIAAPAMTLFAIRLLMIEKRPVLAWTLIGGILSMTLLPELLRKTSPDFGLWWHPAVMLAFLAVFLWWLGRTHLQAIDVNS